jgi:hypothetical protein
MGRRKRTKNTTAARRSHPPVTPATIPPTVATGTPLGLVVTVDVIVAVFAGVNVLVTVVYVSYDLL